MNKSEAKGIILDCISRRVELNWSDGLAVMTAVEEALDEIERRRQEAGPEVEEMNRPRCCSTRGQRKKNSSPL